MSAARPKRACTLPAAEPSASEAAHDASSRAGRPRPNGRILIIHANAKPYGTGPVSEKSDTTAVGVAAVKAKASNRNFSFTCADYVRPTHSISPQQRESLTSAHSREHS